MHSAKIMAIGNSLGIVLSREVLARLRVDKGDLLYFVESPLGYELMPYEPQFVCQVERSEQVMRAERDVLHALSVVEAPRDVARPLEKGERD